MRRKGSHPRLIIWVALCSGLLSLTAQADPSEVKQFNIAAQPLDAALLEFSEQSGLQLVVAAESLEGMEYQGYEGEETAKSVLAAMLKDTSLRFNTIGATITITDKGATKRKATEGAQAETTDAEQAAGRQPNQTGSQNDSGDEAAEQETNEAAGPLDLAEQTVTGSRLRGFLSGLPVIVLTREQIRQRGFGSVEDIVRSLPQNYSETNAATVLDNTIHSIDAQGQATVNLRGFGNNATLVLVNGRRWVQGTTVNRLGANGAVNINGIPFSAIERVEILTGGASAIYGADAQAGVVNFILRNTYSGAETMARYEMGAHEGDAQKLEQNITVNWKGGNAFFSLGYAKNEPVDRFKAGFISSDYRSLGGSDRRTQPGASGHSGQPGIVSYGIQQAGFTVPLVPLGALPASDDGTGGVFLKLSPANLVPIDLSALGRAGITAERDSLFGHLSLRQEFLDERWTAYADLSANFSDSFTQSVVPQVTTVVPYSNPYNDLPPHPFFVTVVSYAFSAEVASGLLPAPSRISDQDQETYTLGLSGDLPLFGWTGDVSYSSGSQEASFYNDSLDTDLLAQRLAGVDASGNPRPLNQVVNLFGNGAAQDAAAVEGLINRDSAISSRSSSDQDDFLITANGPFLRLPAGASLLAVGGEYRDEEVDYLSDPNRSRIFSLSDPERKINSYFAELGMPLGSNDAGIRGLGWIWARLAVRYDDYSFSGPFDGPVASHSNKTFDNLSPKAELVWAPTLEFRLRASWAESFVPPTINDLFGFQYGPFPFYPVVDIENPAAGVQYPDAYLGGNPDLKPEVSDTLAIGFDWTPKGVLDGLTLSVTWFDTSFRDRIGSGALLFFTAPELVFEVPNMVIRDAEGRIDRLNIFSINIATRTSESVDVALQYEFETVRWGDFTVGVDGSFTALLEEVSFPGGSPMQLHGTLHGPERWKARGFASWGRGNATLNLAANYSSSYAVPGWAAPQTRVENYMTLDLTGSYEFGDSGWKLYAGARNITNREFPFFNGLGGAPWDPRRVDTRGRVLYFEIRKTYDLF